jgi:hypothetical protein
LVGRVRGWSQAADLDAQDLGVDRQFRTQAGPDQAAEAGLGVVQRAKMQRPVATDVSVVCDVGFAIVHGDLS